jgi:hypothetical protein
MAEPMDKDLIDLQPDALERFERAVDTVSKQGESKFTRFLQSVVSSAPEELRRSLAHKIIVFEQDLPCMQPQDLDLGETEDSFAGKHVD